MANCTACKVLNKISECNIESLRFLDFGRVNLFADSCRYVMNFGKVSQTSCVLVVIPTFGSNIRSYRFFRYFYFISMSYLTPEN